MAGERADCAARAPVPVKREPMLERRRGLPARSTAQWAALAAGVAVLLAGFAAAAARPLELKPAFKAGDAFALLMSKTRERVEGGNVVFRGRTETPVEVTVVQAGPEGWLIDWTFGRTRLVEPPNLPPPPDAALFDGVTLRLRLDANGRPRSIENYPEVRQRIDAAIVTVLAPIGDPAARGRAAALLRESLGSQQQLESLVLADIGHYFLPYSAPLDADEARQREVELPSPAGGQPLRGTDRFTIVRLDASGGERVVEVQWTQTMDPAELARLARDLEQRLRDRGNMQPGVSQPQVPHDLEAQVQGRFEVPLEGLGVPRVAEIRRRSGGGGVTITDTVRFARTR